MVHGSVVYTDRAETAAVSCGTHGHSVIKTTTESFQRQQGSDDHSALSDLVAEMESVLRGFVKK